MEPTKDRERMPVLQTKHPRQLWIKQTYTDMNQDDGNYSAGEITEFIPIDDTGEEDTQLNRVYKGSTLINSMPFTFDIPAASLLDAKNAFDASLRLAFARDYRTAMRQAQERMLLAATGKPL